jgi:hypothetical protein
MLKANLNNTSDEEKLPPQDELLLLLIAPEVDIEKVKKLFNQDLNWEDLIKKAWSHRVAPIVFYNLQKFNLLTKGNENVSKTLQNSYFYTLKNNMSYYSELTNILKVIKEEKIEVLVLKGAAFAEILYEKIGLRHFRDIDLLFRKEEVEKVRKIFSAMGYSLDEEFRPKRYYQDYHFHMPYSKKTKNAVFNIELHWDLHAPRGPIRIDIDEFWLKAIPITINGSNVKSLSWNHNLLYLSWHNANDSFRELLGLCDMAKILHRFKTEVSYDLILEEALRTNLKIPVYYSFLLTQKLFGIPKELELKRIEPQEKEAHFFNPLLIKERILKQYVRSDWIISALARMFLYEGFKYRASCLIYYLFPQEEDLDKFFFENPEAVTAFKKIEFFFKGLKVLFHMLWFLISPTSLQKFMKLKRG